MGDSFHYIKQQALCMLIGLGCMFAMSYVDHRFLRRMVWPGYLIVLAMLAVTLTMAPLNGCRRWIRFAGLTLQSSEVAKFEMILFSSHLAAKAPQVERLDPERRILLTPRSGCGCGYGSSWWCRCCPLYRWSSCWRWSRTCPASC